ncbi:DUF7715 family protein [Actinophytocola sp.]|uniref:DUF7715 family protein n=1 Tax=Actinophytocola sp. TaxID=1872138 RepID=UPI002D8017B9|nr:hypothetical protein [Actinophytocola sp.]HET9144026.1 hypothetical protein [Actinophytocola sp.]
MSTMPVLVATRRTQGTRSDDFCYTQDDELVDLASTCHDDPGSACGCARAFTGLITRKATTTAQILTRALSMPDYIDAFRTSLITAGLPDDQQTLRWAHEAAEQLHTIASQWPPGTVVERRGDDINVRVDTTPMRT